MDMIAVFEGLLTPVDAKQHVTHQFVLPPQQSPDAELRIRLVHVAGHTGGEIDLINMLCLTVFDPTGCRGAGHRSGTLRADGRYEHDVRISIHSATPGYCAGPLQAGKWTVVIDTHRITDTEPCVYQIDVTCASIQTTSVLNTDPVLTSVPPNRGPGWYRGDLHGHTLHSDGSWEIKDLVASARQFKLDFVTLSDHNTISGLAEMDSYTSADLLTLGGLELTTYWGHALALGTRSWIDWRVNGSHRTMPMIAQEVIDAGMTYIIAHPMAIGDPICTGCSWVYADMRPGPAQVVEIWNGGDWDNESFNEKGLALYYSWLNQGYRLAATAGTDIHGPLPADMRPGFNVVYAEALSESAILKAVRAGHVFVSNGAHIELTAKSSQGHTGMMGDLLPLIPTTLTATWRDIERVMQLRIIVDGNCIHQQTIPSTGKHEWMLDGQARWCNIELRDSQQRVTAVTNPVFFGIS